MTYVLPGMMTILSLFFLGVDSLFSTFVGWLLTIA